jgi:broad specificity phosphatase PhoE
MTTRVLLIRHGQTEHNAARRYCGFLDVGLSRKGRTQVKKLAGRMARKKVDVVYASDRLRALQTAAIAFRGREVVQEGLLREMHFGVFEGLTHEEILKKHPRIYRKWLDDPFDVAIPKGESLSIFRKRVMQGMRRIVRRHPGKTVAVVCHGGTISVFVTHLLKSKKFWEHIPRSASLTVVAYRDGKPMIVRLNDTEHLHGKTGTGTRRRAKR